MYLHRASVCASIRIHFLVVFVWMLLTCSAHAVPYHGDIFVFNQPDGSSFQIRLYGDEFYSVAETLDGYTVVRDLQSGMFCYARLADDGDSLVSTGVAVAEESVVPEGVPKGVRISRSAMNAQSRVAREKFGVDERGMLLPALKSKLRPQASIKDGIQPSPPDEPTVDIRVGLVLLAQFPDFPEDVVANRHQVDAFCNDPNYSQFGNATSVFGYFYIQSGGKLRYNSIVTAYFTAANNRAYYTDEAISYSTRAKELINEGLQVLKDDGFDFTKCDGDNNGILDGVNLFYAGKIHNSPSSGLWPHKYSSYWVGLGGEGVGSAFQYQITNMGTSLTIGTYCHENGHMLCDFPDLYSYNGNAANIGRYSLMSIGGGTHPVNVDAYLKVHAGWADVVDIDAASHLRGTVIADDNRFYRFKNPAESLEYFLLSMRTDSGYEGVYGGAVSAANPGNGLVIWHARDHGSNTYSSIDTEDSPSASYSKPYELMVVEANPSSTTTPWYDDPFPGSDDTYHSADISEASDSTLPALKFWNTATGRTTTSNLHIHSIGAQGDVMTFTVGTGALTGSPAIGLSSTTLTAVRESGGNAAADSFAVFNSSAGTLNYSITENVSWLSLSSTSGSATTEADLITVSYDTDELSPGTYNGTITVTDSGATNSPQTVLVTLTVSPQPTISLNTDTVSISLAAGDNGTSSFIISNSGGGTLEYALAESVSWLSLSTISGTVAAEEDMVIVNFDATNMVDGTHTRDITISSENASNSQQTLRVTMTVSGPDAVLVSPNGGETIRQSNTQDIIWRTVSGIIGNIRIDLYKGGALDSTIVANTANDSLYSWAVPNGQAIGSDYKIRISSVENAGQYAESLSNFSIAALPPLVSIPYTESFETDFGDWIQDATDDMDWTRRTWKTPTTYTGPVWAQDGNFYIYTEATYGFPSKKTTALSCYFDLRTAVAPVLSAYYHMYGANMGSLVIRASSDEKNWTDIFSKSGNQGDSWQYINADLSAFAGNVITLQIIGTTGNGGYLSDMALDHLDIAESTRSLTYGTDTFSEDITNDGSISNSIVITLAGDTLTSTAVSDGHITAVNVPVGLTAHFVRDSSTQITMTLTGRATDHDNEDNILNLPVTFADAAFTSGNASAVAGNVTYLMVDYIQMPHTVDASVDAGGVLDATSTTVEHGCLASFTVMPNSGYATDTPVGGTCPTGTWSGSTYTTAAITEACDVSFSHSIVYAVTVTPSAGAHGSISPDTPQVLARGETTSFQLFPDTGYSPFVTGSCGGILINNTYTSNIITADCSVEATFHLPGDINQDDVVDLADTILALQIITGTETASAAADINGDGKIGLAEVLYSLQKAGQL